eukprot:c15637_g1_i2.p1 GENE.c15637_g1_i2~~c15637_g1_i2.p1  ORF type:complete len:484 (+),score=135.25 c15637_g1_i2:311-1762(+)
MRRTQKEILLVPECCCMTGLTDDMIQNFQLMKDIGEHTRVGPNDRVQSYMDFRQKIEGADAKQTLQAWSVDISANLLQIPARVFPAESILYKEKKEVASSKADWQVRSTISDPVPLKADKWLVVYARQDERVANSFLDTLQAVSKQLGVPLGKPVIRIADNDRAATYIEIFKENLQQDFQVVVAIVPSKDKRRYDELKVFLTTVMPLPSQIIVSKTISKERSLLTITNKIAQQIQAKIGGNLWRVEMPLNKTMIIGIDVYHDSARQGESVLAFCASYNASFTQYFSQQIWQRARQEISSELSQCMKKAIDNFYQKNQALPERIIVYRDGVGLGQLDAVMNFEIPQMRLAFGNQYKPKFAVIVVQKRISTRFFDAKSHGNMPPGLVVDRQITSAQAYDFFLLSQAVTQGTATPTRYLVLEDDTGLKPDHMQQLTYKLTHLYYNWSGTVRVPAPCQYAHKLAFLVGQSIHKAPNQARLASRLFFL